MADRGTFWKRTSQGRDGEYVWVRFIFQIKDGKAHFLEYVPDGKFPHQGNESEENWEEYWDAIPAEEAVFLVGNMAEQDDKFAFRLGKVKEAEKLAEALKILKGKEVSSVSVYNGEIRVDTSNGASYGISFTREGFESRQTGLPDIGW